MCFRRHLISCVALGKLLLSGLCFLQTKCTHEHIYTTGCTRMACVFPRLRNIKSKQPSCKPYVFLKIQEALLGSSSSELAEAEWGLKETSLGIHRPLNWAWQSQVPNCQSPQVHRRQPPLWMCPQWCSQRGLLHGMVCVTCLSGHWNQTSCLLVML